MDDEEDGTRAGATSWRETVASWLILAIAAYWIAASAWWVVDRELSWLQMGWGIVMASLTILAAFATRKPTTGWQLFARVVVAGPLFGHFILHGSPPPINPVSVPFFIGLVTALVLMGKSGLGPDGGPFAPTRFRGLLIVMIVAAGVMAYTSSSIVFEGFVVRVIHPDSPLPWQVEVRRVLFLFAYAVTALGLYKMRVVALAVPLLLGGYLLFKSIAGPDPDMGPGFTPSQEILNQIRWDGIRYSSIVILLSAPFLVALAWLRLRARGSTQR